MVSLYCVLVQGRGERTEEETCDYWATYLSQLYCTAASLIVMSQTPTRIQVRRVQPNTRCNSWYDTKTILRYRSLGITVIPPAAAATTNRHDPERMIRSSSARGVTRTNRET
jgi:hypothetical protein